MIILTRLHRNDIRLIQLRESRRIRNLQRDIAILEDRPATRSQVAKASAAIVLGHIAFVLLFLAFA